MDLSIGFSKFVSCITSYVLQIVYFDQLGLK